MVAPQIIIDLVDTFKKNEKTFKDPQQFDEENTKTDFINPFFEALGWDVLNKDHAIPAFKDVLFEKKVETKDGKKSPDYTFQIGGNPIFFVEAKKPSVDIENDRSPAYQVRRYGWSAKLDLCILTDFEHLAIYETRTKPAPNQHASVGRIELYHYTQYEEKWDEISSIFSKYSVTHGGFDNFVNNNSEIKKRGTEPLTDEFLKEINEWRLKLARNIALRNPELTVSELNYAVQLTIDRIIFFRMAEDRGIERYETLKKLLEKPDIYSQFIEVFKKADLKYNSGLFHFNDDKTSPEEFVDRITLNLKIDDGVFKEIFKNLYFPNSPYEFSVISPEILGSVYEQFLGQTIRLTPSHQAKVEVKPEVRKGGGVYYTPRYIVDKIINDTIEKQIAEKTPKQISEMKFIDISCGSGSFLIGAYQKLLDYHLNYYIKNYKKSFKNCIYKGKDNKYRLTVSEKKKILLNNIYGVDIDVNAVEVTKLSLLLKVLEDENKDQLEAQQKLYQERVLPNLSNNIKCGNSLISTDVFHQNLSEKELFKINPFNFEEEFYNEFKFNGGFDVVIGNPPYFNIETWGAKSKQAEYIKNNYEVYMDKTDILFYFIEKAIKISKKDIGFIISNAFLFSDKAVNLRNYILDNAPVSNIINFENFKVFKANIYTCILELDKDKKNNIGFANIFNEKKYTENEIKESFINPYNTFPVEFKKNNVFPLISLNVANLNSRIDRDFPLLGDLFVVGSGMQTAANDVFSFMEYPEQFPPEFIKKRITGPNIKKYHIKHNHGYLLYVEDVDNFKDLPDSIKDYLKKNRKILSNRADKKRRKTAKWWNYTFAMHKELYHLPKLYTSYRNNFNTFALDENNEYLGLTNTTIIFGTNPNLNLKYVACLLNSYVLDRRYKSIGKNTGNYCYEYFANGISKLPIPVISKEDQKPFIEMYDKIDALNYKKDKAKSPKEKKLLQEEIAFLWDLTSRLVSKLYYLSEEDIMMVEGI